VLEFREIWPGGRRDLDLHWRHTLAGLAILTVAATPAYAAEFLKAIDDVPLMGGLAEAVEPVVFESDQGRVVRTSAFGHADYSAVREFYLASLPALGWKRQGDGPGGVLVFVRGDERLTLSIEPSAGVDSPINVIFELVVKLASVGLPE
jgi:hypothetical protein